MPDRWTFQQAMELSRLDAAAASGSPQFLSRRPAWLPGADLDGLRRAAEAATGTRLRAHDAAFGGHVYAQSVLAMCEVMEREQLAMGLHTIHGYFTAKGKPDRPYLYSVSLLTRGRSLVTARVDARQPRHPIDPLPDGRFPLLDAAALDAADALCFTAIASFVLPRPHSLGQTAQAPPVQQRFAALLAARPPAHWDPSPPVDMDLLLNLVDLRDLVGSFPLVDMKKVDLRAYNAGRPLHARRELILYRLLGELPVSGTSTCTSSAPSPNHHILVHAYAADRNGLLMAANHVGFALHDRVATVSNTLVVHTNVDAAVMAFHDGPDAGAELAHWWVQEVCFPRAAAGRAIVLNKLWSPAGVHVATEYQDGLCTGVDAMGLRL